MADGPCALCFTFQKLTKIGLGFHGFSCKIQLNPIYELLFEKLHLYLSLYYFNFDIL